MILRYSYNRKTTEKVWIKKEILFYTNFQMIIFHASDNTIIIMYVFMYFFLCYQVYQIYQIYQIASFFFF
jgi:hypothetical protein